MNHKMQFIYNELSELKHASFHIILIGHLAKKYQKSGSALRDMGLRVLADAVLLVERSGEEHIITPIIKPPRPGHLQLDRRYPAMVSTLAPGCR